jgi:alginate O-acetyltransferase complex protein AlgI
MLFNSLHFILFFVFVTLAYFSLGWRGRWMLLLLASCYFYMVFVPYYIIILAATIVIDYFAGIWIEKTQGSHRRWALILSLISNVGILAVFKYYNFFTQNLEAVLARFGIESAFPYLEILLPVGLSFHTFQAMSYTIEVYRGNQPAERHFGIYALYVMFYPQLVAGPIERPQNVLNQFHSFFEYDFENVKAGLMRMAWGMFKKVVIADRLALVVDAVYPNPHTHNGLTLLVATFFFTFQIYCDFSGYSDIALGAARVMGFRLMENFKAPYFSASISEFWGRWHISLSTWFRDYLYIPLGGNQKGEFRTYFNRFFVFMVSGLWHGANWTFVIWGALHGAYLILAQVRDKFLGKPTKEHIASKSAFQKTIDILFTFVLVMLTWVFFAARSWRDAFHILKKIILHTRPSQNIFTPLSTREMFFCLILIIFLLWKDHKFFEINTKSTTRFYLIFGLLVAFSYFFGVFGAKQFIYFQF